MRVERDPKDLTPHGKGTHIRLDSNEVAEAICAYVQAQGIRFGGVRTVWVRTVGMGLGLAGGAAIYVDPSGWVDDSAVGRLGALALKCRVEQEVTDEG